MKLAAGNSEENVAELLAGIPGVQLVGQRSNWMNYKYYLAVEYIKALDEFWQAM